MSYLYSVILFLITICLSDLICSMFLEKEFYVALGKGGENVGQHGDITGTFMQAYPESEFELYIGSEKEQKKAGSLFWLPYKKRSDGYGSGSCKIFGIGDSITYGMGVEKGEEYLSHLATLLKNTQVYNYGVNGHGMYQSYLMNKHYIRSQEKNLVIWQFFGDDFKMFKYIHGRIYNTELHIDYLDKLPILFESLGNDANNWLLKRSYLYNKLLIFKIRDSEKQISNTKYLLSLFEEFLKDKKQKNEKFLMVLGLDYEIDVVDGKRELRSDYKMIVNLLDTYNFPYVNLIETASKEMFLWDNIHFTIDGHKIVAEQIMKAIKKIIFFLLIAMKTLLNKQFIRYATLSILPFGTDIGCYFMMIYVYEMHVYTAFILSFLCGSIIAFFITPYIFGNILDFKRFYLKFLLIEFLAILIGEGIILFFLYDILELHYLLSKFGATGIVFIGTFALKFRLFSK